MATKKIALRSVVVELPEPDMMRVVNLAEAEGVTVREFVGKKLLESISTGK